MSRMRKEDHGCCASTCRCMFGYFPWVPMLACSAVSVFIIFWKYWTDPAAKNTKTLLAMTGIRNSTADGFISACTLATSIVVIFTLACMAAILLMSIFKGHQKALHHGVYGQGQMPSRYYWIHLSFSVILAAVLYVLVLVFMCLLVAVTLWMAGAAAAETAAVTAQRVYVSNANHAVALNRENNFLVDSYQTTVRPKLSTIKDQSLVDNLFATYSADTQNLTYPLQGKCNYGCMDMNMMSDVINVPNTCRCSTAELKQMAQKAMDVQKGLQMALGSIGLAIVSGIILLMNLSSRITDTSRDLKDIKAPEEASYMPTSNSKALEEGVKLPGDTENGLTRQAGHPPLSASIQPPSSRQVTPSAGPALHTPLAQPLHSSHSSQTSWSSVPATEHSYPSQQHSARQTEYRPPRTSHRPSDLPPQQVSPPLRGPSPNYTPPNLHTELTTSSSQGYPYRPPASPSVTDRLAATPASSAPLNGYAHSEDAGTSLSQGLQPGASVTSVDLKDGWRSIAARYTPPPPPADPEYT